MNNRKTTNPSYLLSVMGILVSMALILSIVESILCPQGLLPVPGFKLGMANIAIVVSIYLLGPKPTVGIVLVRALLLWALGGNTIGLMFSLAGGLLALLSMSLLQRLPFISLWGVSIAGAAAHMTGQIVVAIFLTGNTYVVSYLSILLLTSILTGGVIAFLSAPVINALLHVPFVNKIQHDIMKNDHP